MAQNPEVDFNLESVNQYPTGILLENIPPLIDPETGDINNPEKVIEAGIKAVPQLKEALLPGGIDQDVISEVLANSSKAEDVSIHDNGTQLQSSKLVRVVGTVVLAYLLASCSPRTSTSSSTETDTELQPENLPTETLVDDFSAQADSAGVEDSEQGIPTNTSVVPTETLPPIVDPTVIPTEEVVEEESLFAEIIKDLEVDSTSEVDLVFELGEDTAFATFSTDIEGFVNYDEGFVNHYGGNGTLNITRLLSFKDSKYRVGVAEIDNGNGTTVVAVLLDGDSIMDENTDGVVSSIDLNTDYVVGDGGMSDEDIEIVKSLGLYIPEWLFDVPINNQEQIFNIHLTINRINNDIEKGVSLEESYLYNNDYPNKTKVLEFLLENNLEIKHLNYIQTARLVSIMYPSIGLSFPRTDIKEPIEFVPERDRGLILTKSGGDLVITYAPLSDGRSLFTTGLLKPASIQSGDIVFNMTRSIESGNLDDIEVVFFIYKNSQGAIIVRQDESANLLVITAIDVGGIQESVGSLDNRRFYFFRNWKP